MAMLKAVTDDSHLNDGGLIDDRPRLDEHPVPGGGRGPGIFAIFAGGISGAIVGFFIAGSLLVGVAALGGVIAGLVLGWQAARLTES